MVVSTDRGFRFEHPVLAEMIYQDIPGALCREYHRVIAEGLERKYGPDFGAMVGDIALHFFRGGEHSRALPLLYPPY